MKISKSIEILKALTAIEGLNDHLPPEVKAHTPRRLTHSLNIFYPKHFQSIRSPSSHSSRTPLQRLSAIHHIHNALWAG